MFVHVPQSYRIPFFFYCTTFLDLLFPYSCKALLSFVLFSLTLLLLTLLVVPPCPKVVMMTLNLPITGKFFFLLFTIRICAVITRKWNRPPPHTGALRVLRSWGAAHCTSWISHPHDIGNVQFYTRCTQYRVHAPSLRF